MITPTQETDAAPTGSTPKQSQPAQNKSAAKRKVAVSKRTSAPATGKSAQKIRPASGPQSKQDRVLSMLRRAEGVTIVAIMKATGWQTHSVRGFFAGVVRKKLRLNLVSEKTDGKRFYRLVDGKAGTKPRKRADGANMRARKQAAA